MSSGVMSPHWISCIDVYEESKWIAKVVKHLIEFAEVSLSVSDGSLALQRPNGEIISFNVRVRMLGWNVENDVWSLCKIMAPAFLVFHFQNCSINHQVGFL